MADRKNVIDSSEYFKQNTQTRAAGHMNFDFKKNPSIVDGKERLFGYSTVTDQNQKENNMR